MIGATKGPTGGFGITSLPSAGVKAPAEVGKAVEQLKGALEGLKNNPIVRQLLGESGFDSVQGKGKAEKAGKAEGGEATSEDSIKKLVEGLKKFVEALEELLGKKGAKGGEKAGGAEGAAPAAGAGGGAGGAEGAGGAQGAALAGGGQGAGSAGGAEGAQSAAPAEGEDAKDPLSQLLKVLKQFVEQLQQLQSQLQQQGGNQNPGIVPPAGNTGIVPPTETAAV